MIKYLKQNILFLFIGMITSTSLSYHLTFDSQKPFTTAAYNNSYSHCFKIEFSWLKRSCLKTVYAGKVMSCKKYSASEDTKNKCIREIKDERITGVDWIHILYILLNIFLILLITVLMAERKRLLNRFDYSALNTVDNKLDKLISATEKLTRKLGIPFGVFSYLITILTILLTCLGYMYIMENAAKI